MRAGDRIPGFLIKYRFVFLGLMVAFAAFCITLVPAININSDMTQYLPSDSRMREGMDSMKVAFPSVDMNAYVVSAMFRDVQDVDSLGKELLSFDGLASLQGTRIKDSHVLYRFSVEAGADPKATASAISARYGDEVVVETNANSIMPDNMVLILIIGVVLIFGILFFMCSSFVEALLFIVTIGLAVVINMGTNAFLPSVSMMTNTIVAVLQLVLSMDYSIILMNRYRQVRVEESDCRKAMALALSKASPSILSSSLTTIVGLLALVFMKFRIGLDLGAVLAKGVFFCLISIYTILPSLVIAFGKAIRATEKKVLLMPTDRLARFEMKFRIPLAVLFIVLFAGAWWLHNRTELSYASIWESEIADIFPVQGTYMLLYETAHEDEVIPLVEQISDDEGVDTAISYPSLFLKPMDAPGMIDFISGMLGQLPDSLRTSIDTSLFSRDIVRLLYYAATHPERDEKMSFDDIRSLVYEASAGGMMPEKFDVDSLIEEYTSSLVPDPVPLPSPVFVKPAPVPEQPESFTDTASVPSGLLQLAVDVQSPADSLSRFDYTNVTRRMPSSELAGFLGFEAGQARAIYRMAGHRNGTMSVAEFLSFVIRKVIPNRLYSTFISTGQKKSLYETGHIVDSVVKAGPAAAVRDTLPALSAAADSVVSGGEVMRVDTVSAASSGEPAVIPWMELTPAVPAAVIEETPVDRLIDMASSGRKYSAGQVYRTLNDAGIRIDRSLVDLLFLYHGSRKHYDESVKLSVSELLDYLIGDFVNDPMFEPVVDSNSRAALQRLDALLSEGLGQLRGERFSMAVFVTDYPQESAQTYDFVERLSGLCDNSLSGAHYLIGESVMYKEMKDGFQKELSFLTLITVLAIFLIVAVSFRSLLIPAVLVITVLTGVYVNVFVSGLGGRAMLYLAYLIVQSILMGASIDYGILFTNYYLEKRRTFSVADSLKEAYRGSIHTIMTSGLIIICAPYIMSVLLSDPTISSILSSLTFGALATITIILFVYPAVLAVLDRFIKR